jgi:WD40 repeat protein
MTLFRVLKERVGDHPNIVRLLEVYFEEPPFYVVMDHVEGQDLRAWCEQQGGAEKVPLAVRLEIVAQIADALQAAHDAGVIHRDVKPGNILVSSPKPEAGGWRLEAGGRRPEVGGQRSEVRGQKEAGHSSLSAKLTDFGIGQVVSEEALKGVTKAGFTQTIVAESSSSQTGSQMYMAPELLAGKPATTRSDIYSLGVVLYQLLVGDFTRPITTDWQQEVAEPLLGDDLKHCFAGNPQDRFAAAGLLAKNLRALPERRAALAQQQAELAARERAAYRRGVIRTASLAGLAVALFAVLTVFAFSAFRRARHEAARAEAGETAARKHLYAADMVLAQQAVAEGNLGHAMKLLSKYDPKEAGAPAVKTGGPRTLVSDLRDWEWRYLWQQTRSDELYTLGSHHGGRVVVEVVFAPDGRRLASRSQVGQVILWDMEKKQSIGGWSDLTNDVSAIGFSKDGRTLAIANGSGKAVRFFETTTGREAAGPLFFDAPVWQLAFCPDGKTLAVSTGQELVMVDAATRAERFRKQVPWGSAWRMTFSPDGSTLAMLTDEGDVILWDVASQSQIAKLPGLRTEYARSLAFSPDGNLLAFAGINSRRALIWDVRTKQVIKTLETTTASIFGIAFSPDGGTAAIVTDDQVITLLDRISWQRVGRLKGHLDEVWCVAYSPDGKLLVTGSKDNTVRAWSAAPRAAAEDLLPLPPETDAVRLSADGKTLVSLTTNNSFSLWETAAMRRTVTKPLPWTNFQHFGGSVSGVAISSGGKLLVIPRADGAISAWETDTLREAARLEGFMRPAQVVTLSGDGRTLAAASENAVKLWDLETGKPVASWSNLVSVVRSLFHSPEHKLLIVGYGNGQAEVCDLGHRTHWRARLGHGMRISAAAISPDGRILATGSFDARVKLWDIAQDKLIDTLSGQRNAYDVVLFSPDGRRIAAGGNDGTIRIWDSETHQGVAVLRAHKEDVSSMAFLPDGTTLVSASFDALRVWRAPALNKIESAERLEALQRAERAREEGAITEWLVLAPIGFLPGQTGPEALEAEQVAGERQLRPKGGRTVRAGGRELRWREVRLEDSILDFNEVLGQQTEESVAYAVCYIESETEQEGLRLWVGSDDEAKVYLNGQEKYKCRERRPLIAGQDKVEDVALRAGLNVLVFKVVNEDRNWAGSIRLTDREGNPVKGIKVTLMP